MTNRQPACRGLFITGTGTGVGKTYVTALIAQSLIAAGHRVGVYKPVASGCRRQDGGLVCDDAVALWEAAGRPGDLDQVCPQRFAAPLAPHLAAAAEQKTVDAQLLRTGLHFWTAQSEIVLVEGAGGLMSPVTDDEYVADLAIDLGFPLVVVTPNVLGTIHQTLSTLIAAATFREGLTVAGVALNHPSSDRDASSDTNHGELVRRCVPPVLAEVAWQAERIAPEIDWWNLARP
ncbi:MAG TPA: dethiobiotin synthase [Pirellulales bacterium]|nr:dethiobiotin synthase [Pirellulales bacterium]